jgi:hypothetical protein
MSSIEALTARVNRLERESRRRRAVAIAVVLAGVALVGAGAGRDDGGEVVKARRFVLHDGQGQARAALLMSPEDKPTLVFLGENGWVTSAVPWHQWDQRRHPFLPSEDR